MIYGKYAIMRVFLLALFPLSAFIRSFAYAVNSSTHAFVRGERNDNTHKDTGTNIKGLWGYLPLNRSSCL